ncbi:WW domain protein [Penicillium brasilianum]|uniref:WW domain protein n=1 Tax=Penicillium brasilianum TaxID=104259 RepID=A0A1S9RUS7_PENBI|nr:WW domain protein [Penicillium brasilianum]
MSAQPQVSATPMEDRPGSASAPGTPQAHPEEKLETRNETEDDDPEYTRPEDQQGDEHEEEEQQVDTEEADKKPEDSNSAPPLPDEVPPPLPDEAPPVSTEDDGWEPVWDGNAQAFYFYNRYTGLSQWENPRVPDATAPGTESASTSAIPEPPKKKEPVLGGYNPAIHGDYDPTAPYAQQHEEPPQETGGPAIDPSAAYAATGTFNRFTGRWQAESINPENYNDENKSRRQMNAFFDVDAAANSHDGRSLKAERSGKKLSKKELKMFKEKRREKKEEKRRAWLRD